jgi:hypothetical protein
MYGLQSYLWNQNAKNAWQKGASMYDTEGRLAGGLNDVKALIRNLLRWCLPQFVAIYERIAGRAS